MQTQAIATSSQILPADAAETTDQRLFSRLVAQYSADLQRYAYWLCGDRDIAQDLVQETLLRAWRGLSSLQDIRAAKGWLLTIVRRENARRFERQRLSESDVPLETLRARDPGYDTSTEAFVLRQALQRLPAQYREPLLLQEIGGYSQKEIAQRLGISPAGVGTRLFRARQKLREMLEDGGTSDARMPA